MTEQTLAQRAIDQAGIPNAGISFGDLADRGTWIVHFLPEATPTQRTNAATILASVDISPAAQAAAANTADADREQVLRAVRATVALALRDKLGIDPTKAQIDTAMVRWRSYYVNDAMHG